MSLKHSYVSFREQTLTDEDRARARSNIGFNDAISGKLDKSEFVDWKGSVESSLGLLDTGKQDVLSDAQLLAISSVSSKLDTSTFSSFRTDVNNDIAEIEFDIAALQIDSANKQDKLSDTQLYNINNAITEHQSLSAYTEKSVFNSHSANTNVHVTTADKTSWNAKLDPDDLNGYATESWVNTQNFATRSWVTNKGYAPASAVAETYATKAELTASAAALMKTDLLEMNSDGKISAYNNTQFAGADDHLVFANVNDTEPSYLAQKLASVNGNALKIQWRDTGGDENYFGQFTVETDNTTISSVNGKLSVIGDIGKTYSGAAPIIVDNSTNTISADAVDIEEVAVNVSAGNGMQIVKNDNNLIFSVKLTDVTDIVAVTTLPSTPVSSVLYLIPE